MWGDEEIEVDLKTGSVTVRGPVEFVREIDWLRVEAVALLLARALGPVDALKVAVWRGPRGRRRRKSVDSGQWAVGSRASASAAGQPRGANSRSVAGQAG